MIELNCSYEESKKILELGYDFSKVCDRFFIKYKGYYGDTEGYFFKMNDSSDMFPLGATISTYDEVWDHGISLEHEHEEVTPIIPKAALLMALPSFERTLVSKHYEHLSFVADSDFRFIYLEETHSGNTFKVFDSEEGKEPALIKAFLWCHEHYPEELKKKFDEVMG